MLVLLPGTVWNTPAICMLLHKHASPRLEFFGGSAFITALDDMPTPAICMKAVNGKSCFSSRVLVGTLFEDPKCL